LRPSRRAAGPFRERKRVLPGQKKCSPLRENSPFEAIKTRPTHLENAGAGLARAKEVFQGGGNTSFEAIKRVLNCLDKKVFP